MPQSREETRSTRTEVDPKRAERLPSFTMVEAYLVAAGRRVFIGLIRDFVKSGWSTDSPSASGPPDRARR